MIDSALVKPRLPLVLLSRNGRLLFGHAVQLLASQMCAWTCILICLLVCLLLLLKKQIEDALSVACMMFACMCLLVGLVAV